MTAQMQTARATLALNDDMPPIEIRLAPRRATNAQHLGL
jgi:hypothetical protein